MSTYNLKQFGAVNLLFLLFIFSCASNQRDLADNILPSDLTISIPVGGNTWCVNDVAETKKIISNKGLANWTNPSARLKTYFRTEKTGKVSVGVLAKVTSGQSKVKFSIGETVKEISISNTSLDTIIIGNFSLDKIGYHSIEMQGVEREGEDFATITDVLIGGEATDAEVYFVKNDMYWGRRGPSVHFSYQVPDEVADVKWFYNEITVPEDEDVIGSYFMANGFGEGYFGIQVNSESERRILFSVWSPYKTDNPGEIPDEYKIIMLKKGEGVYTGEFGNEGSGGQSRMVYNWKAGITYKFLLKGEPSENGSTDYTAYFYFSEFGEWRLVASFRRPKTSTYLTRPHSFLENFITETGYKSRKGFYANQWVYDANGNWHELTTAKFTADATARKDARLDYAGGAEGSDFFLKNCGFFDEKSTIDSFFTRESRGISPNIDFSKLP